MPREGATPVLLARLTAVDRNSLSRDRVSTPSHDVILSDAVKRKPAMASQGDYPD